ncbi:MAG: RluA family pseudouridine synthase [Alphaproteobacteria bacterium]|nr:RluA family pseudouridine synthase [Alphaproteobacteria bacterium]
MTEGAGLAVQLVEVKADEADLRLDRWFKRRYPAVSFGNLARLLRTGQVRLDGKRVEPGKRVSAGQIVRIPPMDSVDIDTTPREFRRTDARAEEKLRASVLYRNDNILAIDKPAGLAVQGGTGTVQHLDAMLDALRFDAEERPRLVHRLDKDTSGVLLLARTVGAARELGEMFRIGRARKTYWALVVGVPQPSHGRIELPLSKKLHAGREAMMAGEDDGRPAITTYVVIDSAADSAAWVALRPLTGRTHQLRVHMAAHGTPILGDGKYGGQKAFLAGFGKKLHLHAWSIELPQAKGRSLRIEAPPPPEMVEDLERLGFSYKDGARDLRRELGRMLDEL